MAVCIRCGSRPAADGKSLCPECQAWYDSKSPGASSGKGIKKHSTNKSANAGNGGGYSNPINGNNGGGYTNPTNGGSGYANPTNGRNGGGYTNPTNGGGYTNPTNGRNGGGYTNPTNGRNGGGYTNPGNDGTRGGYPPPGSGVPGGNRPGDRVPGGANPNPQGGNSGGRNGANGKGTGGGNNNSKLPLIIGLVAGILVLAIVVFVVFNFVLKKDKDSDGNSAAGDSGMTQVAETEQQTDGIGGGSGSGSESAAATLSNRVLELQQLYSDQQAEYNTRSDWQSLSVDNMVLYYFDGKLREVEVTNGSESMNYNYDNGEVYYAIIDVSGRNELYWDNQDLICWIESDGTIHNQETSSNEYMSMDSYWNTANEIYRTYGTYTQTESSEAETTTEAPTTEAPTQETINSTNEFVFPNSSTTYISASEVASKTDWELRVARNEIFARYGRKFNDTKLQEYFNGCSWYRGTLEPNAFNYEDLNAVEKKNVDTIKAEQAKRKK